MSQWLADAGFRGLEHNPPVVDCLREFVIEFMAFTTYRLSILYAAREKFLLGSSCRLVLDPECMISSYFGRNRLVFNSKPSFRDSSPLSVNASLSVVDRPLGEIESRGD